MSIAHDTGFAELLETLENASADLEHEDAWPDEQFGWLLDAGVLGWVIPAEFGGRDVSGAELTLGYQRLAQACLVTTFVLTQRNGACQRLAGCDNHRARHELLPRLCRGELFATVGVSHLTTSRRHLKQAAVQVRELDNGFVFDGSVPWVTGATHADYVLTGGRQILAVVPVSAPGVTVEPPAQLLALSASGTGPVRLDSVEIGRDGLVAGPVENVMYQGTGGGAGSLATSALAVGTAARAIDRLGDEAARREDLAEAHGPLKQELRLLRGDLGIATGTHSAGPVVTAEAIRQRANSLVLRSTQAWLAASKGAGFVKGHPAERAVREALFFLVWSCPQPVLSAALREFACLVE